MPPIHRLATPAATAAAAILLVGCTAATTPPPTPAPTPMKTPVPAPTPVTDHLHIVIDNIKFDPQGNDTATATSPDLGRGTLRALLTVDDSDPGPDHNCNTVSEDATFTFKTGTISYRSWHRDCNFGGPRIQTVFAVTGGTGAFAGATGWGTERDDAPDGFAFDGTITHG
jgi:hypothetical protein